MGLKLIKIESRSNNYYVRGAVGGITVFESTKTDNIELATEFLNRRSQEVYRSKILSGQEWTTVPTEMVRELLAICQKANNRRVKRGHGGDRITPEFVTSLYLSQRGKCAVSGITFRLDELKAGVPHSRAFAPSLDRIDNDLGYTQGNVRLVCRIANFAMNTWGDGALLELSLGVAAFWEAVCREQIKRAKPVLASLRALDAIKEKSNDFNKKGRCAESSTYQV